MTAQENKPKKRRTKWDSRVVRKPRKNSKAEAILTLTTTTPATPPQIANQVNTSRQHVHQVLEYYGIQPNTLESFKNTRADILAATQQKDLKIYLSLTDQERKKVLQRRGLVDMGISYDKERLERDLSTDNHSLIVRHLLDMRDRRHNPGIVDNPVDNHNHQPIRDIE